MRDALNATGRPIYFSICQFLPYVGPYPEMHCAGAFAAQAHAIALSTLPSRPRLSFPGGGTAYTVFPWLAAGQNPQSVANSILMQVPLHKLISLARAP